MDAVLGDGGSAAVGLDTANLTLSLARACSRTFGAMDGTVGGGWEGGEGREGEQPSLCTYDWVLLPPS